MKSSLQGCHSESKPSQELTSWLARGVLLIKALKQAVIIVKIYTMTPKFKCRTCAGDMAAPMTDLVARASTIPIQVPSKRRCTRWSGRTRDIPWATRWVTKMLSHSSTSRWIRVISSIISRYQGLLITRCRVDSQGMSEVLMLRMLIWANASICTMEWSLNILILILRKEEVIIEGLILTNSSKTWSKKEKILSEVKDRTKEWWRMPKECTTPMADTN